MRASKLQQILILLSSLYNRPVFVKTKDLAAELDLSERSVRRLIQELRELGYDIESRQGQEGGYRLNTGNLFLPIKIEDRFSQTWLEIRKLVESQPNMSNQENVKVLLDLIEVQSQLSSNIPYQVYHTKKLTYEVSKRVNYNHQVLLEAMENNLRVELKYSHSSKGLVWQEFRPSQIQVVEGIYYVRGFYSEQLDQERILRLSRIKDIQTSYKKMSSQDFKKHKQPFSGDFFVEQQVILHVNKKRDDIIEFEYGREQKLEEYDDYYRLTFKKSGDLLIKELVLSFGKDVKLIAPKHIREEIKKEIAVMNNIYK